MKSPAKSCSYVVDEEPCNPGLYVANYGDIGLPLSDRDAKGLMQKYQKLHKVQSATVAVFEHSEFFVYNDRWTVSFNQQLATLKDLMALDSNSSVRFSDPKLVICGPGGDLLPLLQPQDGDEPFAKLLVTLLSFGAGASMSVSAVRETTKLPSRYGLHYGSIAAIWLLGSDVTWEPPRGVHFATLLYDVVRTSREVPAISSADEVAPRLRELLTGYFAGCPSPNVLAFCLDRSGGTVSTASSIISTLTAADKRLLRCLSKSSVPNHYCIYVARLERRTLGLKYDEPPFNNKAEPGHLDYVSTDRYILTRVSSSNGTVVARKVPFDPQCLMQSEAYNPSRRPEENGIVHVHRGQGHAMTEMKPCYEDTVSPLQRIPGWPD